MLGHLLLPLVTLVASVATMAVRAPAPGCLSPPPDTQTNFDIEKYIDGAWREIKITRMGFEADGECGVANYKWHDNQKTAVDVVNSQYNVSTGKYYDFNLRAAPVDLPNGKFNVTIPLAPQVPASPYWVLGTDYNAYSVVYSCSDTSVSLWVLSKDPSKYTKDVSDTVDDILSKSTDLAYYKDQLEAVEQVCPPTDCSACKYTVDNVDANKFKGRWWEVNHSPYATGTGDLSCSYADITATESGIKIQANSYSASAQKDSPSTIEATWTDSNAKNGNLTITAPEPGRLCVIGTDYDNWAVVSICHGQEQSKMTSGGMYVWSREQGLTADKQMEANKAVMNAGEMGITGVLKPAVSSPCPSGAYTTTTTTTTTTPAPTAPTTTTTPTAPTTPTTPTAPTTSSPDSGNGAAGMVLPALVLAVPALLAHLLR